MMTHNVSYGVNSVNYMVMHPHLRQLGELLFAVVDLECEVFARDVPVVYFHALIMAREKQKRTDKIRQKPTNRAGEKAGAIK